MDNWNVGRSLRNSVWESVDDSTSRPMRTSVFYLVLNSVWRLIDTTMVDHVRNPIGGSIEG